MRILATVFSISLAAVVLVPASAQIASARAPATNYAIPHDSREQIPAIANSVSRPAPRQATIKLVNPRAGAAGRNPRSTCYAIRSYNYGSSDATHEIPAPNGMTTCVAAADTHMRGASAAGAR